MFKTITKVLSGIMITFILTSASTRLTVATEEEKSTGYSIFKNTMVDMKLARSLPPTKVTTQNIGQWRSDTKKLTPLGYLGDPAKTDTFGAKEYMEESCRMMADAIVRSVHQK